MDRIRESRRAGALSNIHNGVSRRRHRTSTFRDSPDDEAELARLRERGGKKERERDRERDRERSRSSKRRRADRLMNAGDESSEEEEVEEEEEESVNDDEEDDDDVDVNFSRMLPPLPTNYNNYNNNSVHSHSQNLNRKSLLPESGKVFKAAAWKASSHVVAGDEMIGVSVPRKARTASTKRSHDWIGGGGGGGEQVNHRQASSSTSPMRGGGGGIVMSTQGVKDSAPLSPPSSSNVSIKKKIRPCGGLKPRPQPRSATTSKSSSSNNNPEELEIEIAEVLYGLMTQSQAPLKNDSSKNEFNSNKSSSEAKSRASSPVSNSSSAGPITAVAPKRKKARQLVDNNLVASSGTWSSPTMKAEIDQTRRSEVCPPNLERNFGSAAENGESANSGKSGAEANQHLPKSMKLEGSTLTESKGDLMEEAGESRDAVSTTKEVVNSIKKDSAVVKLKDDPKAMIMTSMVTSTNVITEAPANENKREEDFQIDLMAPPPQFRSSPERDRAVSFISDRDRTVFDMEKMGETSKVKETGKVGTSKEDTVIQSDEKGAKTVIEEVEFQKSLTSKERNNDLHFGLEKSGMENGHLVQSQGQYSKSKPAFKEEQLSTDRSAQSISLPLPMSVASWPGGIPPPIGYMAPLQGVVSVEGGTMPPAPFQPLFSQPRPKRCATHCHIARNIQYYQQLMKMNPFWPAPSGTASMFGAKPANVNVMNPTELHGNSSGRSLNSMQDKGHSLAIFPSNAVKEKFAQSASIADAGHGKQQILLQHALPPVPPNNMMHGPAFIFPFNQQQAAVLATSGRPASAKSPTTTATGSLPCTGAPNLTTVTASASAPANASALGFNYPNMPANETQYLVLQNSPYPFPIPAVGAPQNFRGHAQPMPMFNGSFYPSQMIHPLQLQQQQAPTSQQQQIQKNHQNTSSGPASSQKHLQSQQHRPQGIAINGGGTENGVLQNFAAPKSRSSQHPQQNQNQHIPPSQARQLESEVGGENSPSTADSRGSRAPVNIYNHNFAMPINSQNFALMSSSAASAGATGAGAGNHNDKKQTHHQHPGFKSGAESLPSQAFAMSFGPMIGSTSASGIDLSSMSQNHAILQSLPEATRQSYHQVMQAAATAQAVQQKKNSRLSEDGKIDGAVSINADEERKVITGKGPASSGGQSISFSRPDFADASESATPNDSATNSIARILNLAPGSTHMPNGMNLGGSSNSHLHAQLQHQQLIQMHNQQQHQQQQLAANVTARSKTPTSNGISSSEHLTSASVAGKFPNSISGFPPNFIQSNNSSSPTQSSQWKNSNRTSTSQVQSSLVSSTASPKNHQQQHSRTLQNHTQISFGTNQKSSASQGQQQPNSSQSPSPPVAVGSPTHSSLSKGASSSPRTNTAPTNKTGQASTLSSQQPKNSTSVPSQKSSPAGGRNVPSVLGNPHSASQSATTKTQIQTQQLQQQQRHQQQFQQQLSKQTLQQALFFSNPYFQGQPLKSASSNTSAASGYNLQRRHSEQPQGSSPSSGMLSMCPPATQSNTSTTDPAKAAAAAAAVAAAASNMKGGGFSSQGILHSAQFGVQSGNSYQPLPVGFSYGHSVPAVVQVKPAEQKQPPEQKQPAA